MKRLLMLLVLLMLLPIVASARGHLVGVAAYSQYVTTVGSNSTNKFSRILASATVTVYTPTGTTTIATLYSDAAGTPKSNPFTAGSDGSYSFYTDATNVDIRYSNVTGVTPFTLSDIRVVDAQTVVTAASCGVFGAPHGSTPTDESAAMLTCLSTLYTAGGGSIVFANRAYRFDSSLLFPNDGTSSPSPAQPSFRLTGQGASHNGQGGAPFGGTIIDLRYNGILSKIDTRGLGLLEIDHITFKDGGSASSVPFIQTTNTTLHIHHTEFYGNTATTPTQDAIVLGNTSTVVGGNFNAPFQGYGTVIESNYFNRIQRGVYGRTYANNIIIQNNTWFTTCGGIAAIEFLPDITNTDTGNVIVGNLFELNSYTYGMKFNSQFIYNNIGPNGFFDSGVGLTAIYRFESGATFNRVEAGYHEDTETFVSDANVLPTQTIITSHQSQVSQFPNPMTFLNSQTKIVGDNIGLITQNAAGDQWLQSISPTGTAGKTFEINFSPLGVGLEGGFKLFRQSSTDMRIILGGSGRSTFSADSADLYLRAGTGQTLHLGTPGNENVLTVNASTGSTTALPIVSTLATGTAPFTIASTTPVANLTVTAHPQVLSTSGTVQTSSKIVTGTGTLSGGTVVVSFTGAAVFGGTSYVCTGSNQTNANAFKIANTSASSITITGTNVDVIAFQCIGQ